MLKGRKWVEKAIDNQEAPPFTLVDSHILQSCCSSAGTYRNIATFS